MKNDLFDTLSEQAAGWLLIISAGEMSDQEKIDYIHWLKESPSHICEILELVSLDQLLREAHAGELLRSEAPIYRSNMVS